MVAAVAGLGGRVSAESYSAPEPPGPPPAAIRKCVFDYLTKKGGPPPQLVLPKDKAPSDWCLEQYEAAVKRKDPKAFYRLLHGQLLLAQRLIEDKEQKELPWRQTPFATGLTIATYVDDAAIQHLQDKWLAPKICEGFVLPLWEVAEPNGVARASKMGIVTNAVGIYMAVGDRKKYIEAYKLYLSTAIGYHTTNSADAARVRLGAALLEEGDYEQALRYLEDIDPKGSLSGSRSDLIALVKKAMAQKKK
jgi:tetratricopeptide (TPR) repeat protein